MPEQLGPDVTRTVPFDVNPAEVTLPVLRIPTPFYLACGIPQNDTRLLGLTPNLLDPYNLFQQRNIDRGMSPRSAMVYEQVSRAQLLAFIKYGNKATSVTLSSGMIERAGVTQNRLRDRIKGFGFAAALDDLPADVITEILNLQGQPDFAERLTLQVAKTIQQKLGTRIVFSEQPGENFFEAIAPMPEQPVGPMPLAAIENSTDLLPLTVEMIDRTMGMIQLGNLAGVRLVRGSLVTTTKHGETRQTIGGLGVSVHELFNFLYPADKTGQIKSNYPLHLVLGATAFGYFATTGRFTSHVKAEDLRDLYTYLDNMRSGKKRKLPRSADRAMEMLKMMIDDPTLIERYTTPDPNEQP